MKPNFRRYVTILLCLALSIGLCFAQKGGAKPAGISFHGTVQSVNESAKGVTVKHGKIEGWMDAMTMMYIVDKPEILKKIKAGDEISATVYDGDYVLHNVEVVPPSAKK